jgi:hypothetical protein
MSFFLTGNILASVIPIVCLDLWLENIVILFYFEKRFQGEVSYWTLGGLAGGLFEGVMHHEEKSLLLSECGAGEKNPLLGEVNEENCLVSACFSQGMEDLIYQGNILVENNLERLTACFVEEVEGKGAPFS